MPWPGKSSSAPKPDRRRQRTFCTKTVADLCLLNFVDGSIGADEQTVPPLAFLIRNRPFLRCGRAAIQETRGPETTGDINYNNVTRQYATRQYARALPIDEDEDGSISSHGESVSTERTDPHCRVDNNSPFRPCLSGDIIRHHHQGRDLNPIFAIDARNAEGLLTVGRHNVVIDEHSLAGVISDGHVNFCHGQRLRAEEKGMSNMSEPHVKLTTGRRPRQGDKAGRKNNRCFGTTVRKVGGWIVPGSATTADILR